MTKGSRIVLTIVLFASALLNSSSVFAFGKGIRSTNFYALRWVNSTDPEVVRLVSELTKPSDSDRQKLYAIHDWVTSHIAFDTTNYFDGDYAKIRYDVPTVLRYRVAVCSGYAALMTSLLRAAGIPTKIVMGKAAPVQFGDSSTSFVRHAWNKVLVDGLWINVDATWDSGYINAYTHQFLQRPTRFFLNMDPVLFEQSHIESYESDGE